MTLRTDTPFKTQLLKWVGNKQRMASTIVSYFPERFGTYYEPFLGSGAVLGTLNPSKGVGSDVLPQLIGIWKMVKEDPERLVAAYDRHRSRIDAGEDKRAVYQDALSAYNSNPNAEDFVFLTRACYGGIVRFRKVDGAMSTPCGAHMPISTESFAKRVDLWRERLRGVEFLCADYREIIRRAGESDLVYCDPPYVDTQKILYGAQEFRLEELVAEIQAAKNRGARVALSIDGSKRSGLYQILHDFPDGLFESEVDVTVGRSMLRRFQKSGQTLHDEVVSDRLMLTYIPEPSESDRLF